MPLGRLTDLAPLSKLLLDPQGHCRDESELLPAEAYSHFVVLPAYPLGCGKALMPRVRCQVTAASLSLGK